MRTKKRRYFKYIAIVLAAVLLITAALALLELWEKGQGRFPESETDGGILEYNGTKYVRRDGIETFLVLGLDKFDGQEVADSHESGVQTDFLMLFVFDNSAHTCTALQINRDTVTRVNKLSVGGATVVDTYSKQIALAYNYVNDDNAKIRCGNTKSSVEYLLDGVKVDHYMALTMDAVPAINDFVGGVEVTVNDDFTGIDAALVKGATVTLHGEQALTYVRTRYGLEDASNTTRMERQRQYLGALYNKAVERSAADEAFAADLVSAVNEYVVYDSADERMLKLVEKLNEYEYLGIRELSGESKTVDGFVEFYPDEGELRELVLELFYTPKA